ncbi:methyltransferase domain-containing protein [Acidithiobacillus ferriphilus]|uniref:methyltransferase domain-containing protein n=1 Tax=Acidithiobacillus ferriphilus TaxID=1689834 RepID=UPI00390C4CE3
MTRTLSNPEQYSQHWKKESEFLDSHHIYEKLSKVTPIGNVLEVGCGAGFGTRHLSNGRNVLSLDSNPHLIMEAKEYLDSATINHNIHKCDLFDLTNEDKFVIKTFNPKIIVGWFIGSHGVDIFKHTEEEPGELEKSKLYREKIEDIIASRDVCVCSVDYIHLVNRGGIVLGLPEDEYFNSTKDDYDTYVFNEIGFEVSDVKFIDWPREGSDFQYGQAPNPNLAEGESVPAITSIIAKRVKNEHMANL